MNEQFDKEKFYLNSDKWINTFPSKSKKNLNKKYFFAVSFLVIGLTLVSVIKNKTRILQKEILNLQSSIYNLKVDLNKATLDHEFITSPDNITLLAKQNLSTDFVHYKKSQIKYLNEKSKKISVTDGGIIINKNKKKLSKKVKIEVAKQIETKKNELKKLKEIYSKPEELPKEVREKITKKIETAKIDLKNLYTDPINSIDIEKVQRWGVIQVVKVFFGMPIVPGK